MDLFWVDLKFSVPQVEIADLDFVISFTVSQSDHIKLFIPSLLFLELMYV